MDIEKEREAFECWFRTTATYKTLWDFISTHQTNIKSVFVKRNGKTYQNDCVQIAWEAWQAAKAQAVQEKDSVIKKLGDQLYAQEMKASAARVLCETACELLDGYAHQDAMVILNDLEQAMKEPAND